MKKYVLVALLTALILFIPSMLRPNPKEDPKATVVFTGDVNGRLEPCG
jgi:hypothetical protein